LSVFSLLGVAVLSSLLQALKRKMAGIMNDNFMEFLLNIISNLKTEAKFR